MQFNLRVAGEVTIIETFCYPDSTSLSCKSGISERNNFTNCSVASSETMAQVESQNLCRISMHVLIIAANNIICRDGSALNALGTLQIKIESMVGDNITVNNHSRWTVLTFTNLKLSISTCESSSMSFIASDISQFRPE